MFKNATVTGFNKKSVLDFTKLPVFLPAGSIELQSFGFSPVLDSTHLTYGKHTLLNFTVEKKHIPASAVQLRLDERCAEIEEAQGFAPGKKARKELKERVIDELLPRALPIRRTTRVWIDAVHGRVVIDSTSNSLVELIQRALIKTFDDIGLEDVSWPSSKVLTAMLGEEPEDFSNDDHVAMQWPGENGKVVSYTSACLDDVDVQANLELGAEVRALAVTYSSRVSCVLTDGMQLRRIRYTDLIDMPAKDADQLTNNFALLTAELSALINAIGNLK